MELNESSKTKNNTKSRTTTPTISPLASPRRRHRPACVNYPVVPSNEKNLQKERDHLLVLLPPPITPLSSSRPSKSTSPSLSKVETHDKDKLAIPSLEMSISKPIPLREQSEKDDDNEDEAASRRPSAQIEEKEARLESSPRPRIILPRLASPRFLHTLDETNKDDDVILAEEPPKQGLVKVLPSILRRSKTYPKFSKERAFVEDPEIDVGNISSIESDMPSLASSSTGEQGSEHERGESHSSNRPQGRPLSPQSITRSVSEPIIKSVQFNPRVWVREFDRSEFEKQETWFSEQEMETFRTAALQRIKQYSAKARTELMPTGTGRMIERQVKTPPACPKALFTHRALRMESSSEAPGKGKTAPSASQKVPPVTPEIKQLRRAVAEHEIRRILVVDPNDLCLKLFTKALKKILPRVVVATAATSEEAVKYVDQRSGRGSCGFDVIIVEERLNRQQKDSPHLTSKHSGSILFQQLAEIELNGLEVAVKAFKSLFIGVSANPGKDKDSMIQSGADFVWSKPPPRADENMRNQILQTLLQKRGKNGLASKLFD